MESLSLRMCFLTLLLAGPGAAQDFFTAVPIDIPLPLSLGVVCGDFDNDQWPDIFLAGWTTGTSPDPEVLLGNQGNGRFADLTALIESDFFPNNARGSGIIFGDYDNDNDLDLYVPRGWFSDNARDRLLRNDQGRFTDVTLAAGLTDSLPSDNAIWLDFDRDGWLDLYVGHTLLNQDAPDLYNSLYRNKGDGTFAEVTEAAGLKMNLFPSDILHQGGSVGSVAGDFNDDGWPDLYLGVFEAPNRLFLNDGQGHFIDATTKEIGDPGQVNGATVGDIDNDGDLDIFQPAGGDLLGIFRSLMLLNLGQGQFLDVTEGVGLASLGAQQTLRSGLADIDNDGDLDLLISTPTALFLNQGDGTFIDATSRSGLKPIFANLAFIDYDRDGFLDVMGGSSIEGIGPGGVFRNNGNGNHWLRVALVGARSNRNGIGARLFATSGGLRQMREILGGQGTQDEVVAHFGLGERTRVDRLEVRWPSGQVDVFTDVPADQQIRVIEGRTDYHAIEPTRWQQEPPETLVAGTIPHLNLAIQPALFEPEVRITRVIADLSPLGGDAEVPLAAEGDGTYHLRDFPLPITAPNGAHIFHVMIDQATSLGPYWTRLSRQVTVVPGRDLMVFDEALAPDWQAEGSSRIKLDLHQAGVVHRGSLAGAFEAQAAKASWSVTFKPPAPVGLVGYTALRFAFHPGNAALPSQGKFSVNLSPGKTVVDLLEKGVVALEKKDWQVVEIPLEAFERTGPIESIIFSGNFAGAFYLDDIRLVTATPSPATVVEEDRTTALPQSFSLSQNFPNPFNSGTVIRFALPEGGEVELAVYNLAGQQVVKLAEGAREAGSYTMRWDGRDDGGRELASGVYLYRLRVGAQVETRKLALVR